MKLNRQPQKSPSNRNKNLQQLAVGIIMIALAAGLVIFQQAMVRQDQIDWLKQSEWSHFPGAEQTDEGINVKPIRRVLTHKDTSAPQPNPPVNVRGSHIEVDGDFQIEMALSGVGNAAAVQFYGQVPVIYDEWRQERGSIRIDVNTDGLSARIWDGTAASSIDERLYDFPLKDSAKVVLRKEGDNITIRLNGRTLGFIPSHGIFSTGELWFGADAATGSAGWTLNMLQVRGIKDGTAELVPPAALREPSDDPNALRNLAEKHDRQLPIGAAVSVYPLFSDPHYKRLALGQFSMMTPENSLKPQAVHPQKDLYTFEEADSLVEAALQNQMQVHGHALVFYKSNPEWMELTPSGEMEQVMTDHITTVVSHYKGKIAQWDVVNEPLSEDHIDYYTAKEGLRGNMWLDSMGEEYIDIAFKAAHAADPGAKLYLNDFGLERDGERWDALISLVKRLQSRGVPIDGVGFEAHVYHAPADTIDPAVLKRHIQTLASLGLDSRISEIDVLGDDPAFQAKQYSEILQVCLSEPTCTSYTTWGITDLYGSTTLSDRYPIHYGSSLLWDVDYQPKPALESLRKTLRTWPNLPDYR